MFPSFCGPFSIRVRMSMWLLSINRKHSTAQHSTAQRNQPRTKQQSKYVSIRVKQHKQADSWRELACRRAFTARCVLKTNDKIDICPAYHVQKYITSLTRSWCDAPSFFLPLFPISVRPIPMQSDWEDRKGRSPMHHFFDGMCLDTFLIVSRIEFVVFLLFFLCSFWGRLILGVGQAKVS